MTDLSLLDIPRLLGFQFFQYALLGGVIAAFACAWVGLFLILRKEAMLGDGVAHTSFGGIALGLLLGISPILVALVVSILAVIGIHIMRTKGLARSDSAIAVMLATGFSAGLIIISLAGGFSVELFSYLFGSILTIDMSDLVIVTVLGLVTLGFLGVFYKEMLSITFDEGAAKLSGIPVETLAISFDVLVATTIVLSIKVVGIVLVVALLVLPGLSALQLNLSFKGTAAAAVCFGTVSMVLGIILSAVYDVATSGVIVFMAAGIFGVVAVYKRLG
ncbi:MAG TPA: metal ABC transporter permease [Thermoplasmata archaeon]|nr:metal ABC transporter permease [Thermoplasmata archaeon]